MARPPILRLAVLLVLLLVSAGLLIVTRHRRSLHSPAGLLSVQSVDEQLLTRFSALEARERQADETAWASERRAEEYGSAFDSLWDELNQATNKFEVLTRFPVGEIVVGKFGSARPSEHQIKVYEPQGAEPEWSAARWQDFLATMRSAGWQLAQIEFRQRSFEIDSNAEPRQSRFYFRADADNPRTNQRATLEGDLAVDWAPHPLGAEPVIKRIDASRVAIRSREGEPPFKPFLNETIKPLEKWLFIDPLILYDLDSDGLSEIILPGKNLVYRHRAGDKYEPGALCKYPPGRIFTAVIADFDGDGYADLLCAKPEGLLLFKGSSKGSFDEPGRLVWAANPPLKYGQALTCGDVDGDGDLDVFLAQYKGPYHHGQMPTPYYDANDGDPAYLLLNDGHGNFTDATEASGLGQKRWRRSYGASLVDLDGDGSLDLVVTSDFAGVDLYHNDGHGHFTDVTRDWVKEPIGFGMAHCLADFNADGRMDLLMIAMGSPTVERLDHLGLRRTDITEDPTSRSRMTFGNRLFLGAEGHFEQTALNDAIAKTGWSWGCTAFDLDNDGFADLYIANGHESRPSVRDYEPEYWLHDIYVGSSNNDPVANTYFQAKFSRTRGHGQSYGGYEKNRLYLNRRGESFFEAGYLMGVGLEEDCRNVVSDDLDGDGRMDLLVTTFEVWPEIKQTLRVYKNTLAPQGNWIGFRFREEGGGKTPVGARITIHYGNHTTVRAIVTGDSYRSQAANTVHFGLGTCTQVDHAEIVWVNGAKLVLKNPEVNRYHSVLAPSK
jgi:hypothetical protein